MNNKLLIWSTVFSSLVLAGTLWFTAYNSEKIQRPYLEIQNPTFTFYDSEEKEIKDLDSKEISKFKASFNVINHGTLPALIVQSDINLWPYNTEWGLHGPYVGKYDGELVTIFKGNPRLIETRITDIKPPEEMFKTFLDYYQKVGGTVPSKTEIGLLYRIPPSFEEIFNRKNNSYYGLFDGVYEAYLVSHCDISKNGISCTPLLTTPGGKKKVFRGGFYYLPGSHQ